MVENYQGRKAVQNSRGERMDKNMCLGDKEVMKKQLKSELEAGRVQQTLIGARVAMLT